MVEAVATEVAVTASVLIDEAETVLVAETVPELTTVVASMISSSSSHSSSSSSSSGREASGVVTGCAAEVEGVVAAVGVEAGTW